MPEHTKSNRPDMIFIDKNNKQVNIIDHNLEETYNKKIEKFTWLAQYIKRTEDLDKTTIIPIIISSTGTVPKTTTQGIKQL